MSQPSLPKKTKFVAWTMIVIGAISIISLLLFLLFNISYGKSASDDVFLGIIAVALVSPSNYLISPIIPNLYFLENFRYRHQGIYKASDFFFYFPYSAYLPYLLIVILLSLFGFLLLKRKRWAWWGTLLFLLTETWFVTYHLILAYPGENIFLYNNPTLYISGILLILLVLDKKNYWKIC